MSISDELKGFLHSLEEPLFRSAIDVATAFKTPEARRKMSLAQIRALLSLLEQEITLPIFEELFRALALVYHKYSDDAEVGVAVMECAEGLGNALRLDDRLSVAGQLLESKKVRERDFFCLVAQLLRPPAMHIIDAATILHDFLTLIDKSIPAQAATKEATAAASALMRLLEQEKLSLTREAARVLAIETVEAVLRLANQATVPVIPFVHLLALRSEHDPRELLESVGQNLLEKLRDNPTCPAANRSRFRLLAAQILPVIPRTTAAFFSTIIATAGSIAEEDSDVCARFQALEAMHALIIPELADAIGQHSAEFIRQVIATGLRWQSGRAAVEVRMAALVCASAALRIRALEASALLQASGALVPLLVGCLTDDWAPELRLQTCAVIGELLTASQLRGQPLEALCVALLERLDDAQDAVRIAAASSLCLLLGGRCGQALPVSAQLQAVQSLFIHLDDTNVEVQEAVFPCVRAAAALQPGRATELATAALSAFRATALPRRLLASLGPANV